MHNIGAFRFPSDNDLQLLLYYVVVFRIHLHSLAHIAADTVKHLFLLKMVRQHLSALQSDAAVTPSGMLWSPLPSNAWYSNWLSQLGVTCLVGCTLLLGNPATWTMGVRKDTVDANTLSLVLFFSMTHDNNHGCKLDIIVTILFMLCSLCSLSVRITYNYSSYHTTLILSTWGVEPP